MFCQSTKLVGVAKAPDAFMQLQAAYSRLILTQQPAKLDAGEPDRTDNKLRLAFDSWKKNLAGFKNP